MKRSLLGVFGETIEKKPRKSGSSCNINLSPSIDEENHASNTANSTVENDNSADESGIELEKKIDLLAGKDWDFILKERNIWHPLYNEDKHLRLIMGNWYPNVGDKDSCMEKFLQSSFAKGVSNYKRYPDPKSKRKYLKGQFEK
uniref:Uncharacterized protein n=1 Tax=Panagrolaimus davidi TaxID=227884 RepID=A0A914QU52_9BILA